MTSTSSPQSMNCSTSPRTRPTAQTIAQRTVAHPHARDRRGCRRAGVLDPFDIRVAGLREQLGQSREQHSLVLDFSSGEDTFDELYVLLRHRLAPFLGEAFGGSTGLVDVGDRKTRDQASHPEEDPSLALSKATGAANQTTVLNDHGKHNPIAEVADFLEPDLQLLVRAKPVLKEAA